MTTTLSAGVETPGQAAAGVVLCLALLVVGAWLLARSRHSTRYPAISAALMCIAVALWVASSVAAGRLGMPFQLYLAILLSYLLVYPALLAVISFGKRFPSEAFSGRLANALQLAGTVIAAFGTVLALLPATTPVRFEYVSQTVLIEGTGPKYWFQIALMTTVALCGVIICIQKIRKAGSNDAAALKVILFGVIASFVSGAAFSALENYFPNVSALSEVETPTIIFLASMVYALVHYGIPEQTRSVSKKLLVVSVVMLVSVSIILLSLRV